VKLTKLNTNLKHSRIAEFKKQTSRESKICRNSQRIFGTLNASLMEPNQNGELSLFIGAEKTNSNQWDLVGI
jgi:hypothetical protein